MRIIAGVLHHETNTLSPLITYREDFEYVQGREILNKIAVTSLFRDAGIEIIPTIYASALASGAVDEKTFLVFCNEILDVVKKSGKVDGIWLYLHGAMDVVNTGSGEAYLLKEIRKLVGYDIPISVALDFHANNTRTLVYEANVICGYRTAPHVDFEETQMRTAALLIKCMNERLLPQAFMVRVPVLTPGDILVTTSEPGKSLIKELDITDSMDGILTSSIFGGQPWVDAPNVGMSTVVVAKKDRNIALREVRRLANLCWNARTKLKFEAETVEPEEIISIVLNATDRPVFISDSGDNTTGGAPGDDAAILKMLIKAGARGVLLGGITDSSVVEKCADLNIGDTVETEIGGRLNPGKSQSVSIKGKIIAKSNILGWFGEDAGPSVLIKVDGIDIIVTERRCGVVSPEIIRSAGANPDDYTVIVVKLGYLWDALKKISKRTVIALTPGATCEDIRKIDYKNIPHPMYPIDGNFEWKAL